MAAITKYQKIDIPAPVSVIVAVVVVDVVFVVVPDNAGGIVSEFILLN